MTQPISSQLLEAQLKKGMPSGTLTLRLAAGPEDIRRCQKLRFEVFHTEMGEGIPENEKLGLDVDAYDQYCDHLMVLFKNELVGTYRVLWAPRSPIGLYTETEFVLDSFLNSIQNKKESIVELGRGCIRKDFRKQSTLMTLFWGLKKYVELRQARFLLGCGSLPPGASKDDAEKTFTDLLAQQIATDDGLVKPKPENNFSGMAQSGENKVPDLLGFYFKFGAKILGRPAYDPVFRCFDLMVLFDMHRLSPWGLELIDRFDKRLQKKHPNGNS